MGSRHLPRSPATRVDCGGLGAGAPQELPCPRATSAGIRSRAGLSSLAMPAPREAPQAGRARWPGRPYGTRRRARLLPSATYQHDDRQRDSGNGRDDHDGGYPSRERQCRYRLRAGDDLLDDRVSAGGLPQLPASGSGESVNAAWCRKGKGRSQFAVDSAPSESRHVNATLVSNQKGSDLDPGLTLTALRHTRPLKEVILMSTADMRRLAALLTLLGTAAWPAGQIRRAL
jgi:hypothetical protein